MTKLHRRALISGFMMIPVILTIGIVVEKKGSYLSGSKDGRAQADISSIETQLLTYEALNGNYPTTTQGLQALVTPPTAPPLPRSWTQLLIDLPQDPWLRPYVYRHPSLTGLKSFDLFSLGPDGRESNDDIGAQR